MIRICDLGASGPPAAREGVEHLAPPPDGVTRWIDICGPTPADLGLLGERFGFHPLTLEDCAHQDQRPKHEEYSGYAFIVIHGFVMPKDDDPSEIESRELHSFLSMTYLVTVHDFPVPSLDLVWERLLRDPQPSERKPDALYHLVADATVDANFAHLDRLSDAIDKIEDTILGQAEQTQVSIGDIFSLKRSLGGMRRTLSPQRDVFATLSRRGSPYVSDAATPYFRDVYDHLVRIYEGIDTARDLLGNALEAHISMAAQRTNEIVKRLTLLSAVFLPLSFVTGFFGQNFTHMPFDSMRLLIVMLAACAAIPLAMYFWFRRSGWF